MLPTLLMGNELFCKEDLAVDVGMDQPDEVGHYESYKGSYLLNNTDIGCVTIF